MNVFNNLQKYDEIILKFRKAKTDSIAEIYYDKENRPEMSNLLNIYSAFSGIKINNYAINPVNSLSIAGQNILKI